MVALTQEVQGCVDVDRSAFVAGRFAVLVTLDETLEVSAWPADCRCVDLEETYRHRLQAASVVTLEARLLLVPNPKPGYAS